MAPGFALNLAVYEKSPVHYAKGTQSPVTRFWRAAHKVPGDTEVPLETMFTTQSKS